MGAKLYTFKYFISESFGEDHRYSGLKPHHSYTTSDGHDIDVHVFNNPRGKHAVFFNKDLNQVTKLVHWSKDSDHPTKDELEKSGYDSEYNLNESATSDGEKLGSNEAGVVAEHGAVIHMLNHMHKQNGTYGTDEHYNDIKPHQDAIDNMAKGKSKSDVELRMAHGKEMANAALEALKLKHGPQATIEKVGHTSKPGDIGRFTGGKHNDTQENPSDFAVTVKNSSLSDDPNEQHYEGYSLKSSAKSSTITAKNPAIHFDGSLDHPTRKLGAEDISRKGLKKVHKDMGYAGVSAAERARVINQARKTEGEKMSSVEHEANAKSKSIKDKIAKELHDHISHLTNNVGQEGHQMVGKLLAKHLTPNTSMPWSKIHVKGDKPTNVRATVTPGSESPLNKIFKNKNTKYAVTQHGARVSFHKVEKDGSLTTLAHYTPKTKSNAFKSDVHGWNVLPAAVH